MPVALYPPAITADAQPTQQLKDPLFSVRAQSHKTRLSALADVRTKLTEIGITLEDRPDGTGWRKAD